MSLWMESGSNSGELSMFVEGQELRLSVWQRAEHASNTESRQVVLSRQQVADLVEALVAWLGPPAKTRAGKGELWAHADWMGDRVALERINGRLLLRTLPADGTSTTVLLSDEAAQELGKLLLDPPSAKKWRIVKTPEGLHELVTSMGIMLAWVNGHGTLRICNYSSAMHDLNPEEFGAAVQELLEVAE